VTGHIPAGYQPPLRQALADAIMFRQARAAGRDDSDQAGLYRKVAGALGLPLPEELPAAGVLLDEDQAATVTAALDDAVAGIRDRAAHCGECAASPADLCDGCSERLLRVELYAELAAALGGER
jgi:hypothetical protein